jgi:RNA polymerase sigma-70 factor, ECF subfamily
MSLSIIARAQQGDQDAFASLIKQFGDVAWRTAWVLTGSNTLAEDAVQEAWLEAWQNLHRYDNTRPFRPWLLAIVAHRAHRLTRRLYRHADVTAIDEILLPAIDDVAEQYLHEEFDLEIRQAIATLPREQREIVDLRYFAELDLAEIADVLNIPVGTVKSRLHRALQLLRSRLSLRSLSHE